jgi:hypothetical protein
VESPLSLLVDASSNSYCQYFLLLYDDKFVSRFKVQQDARCAAYAQMQYSCTEKHLSDDLKDGEIYETSIVPRLEMNRSRFEEQRQALKQADPSIRSQLLGKALYVVRCDPDLAFRFLSENVPAFSSNGRGRSYHSLWAEVKGASLILCQCLGMPAEKQHTTKKDLKTFSFDT